MDFIDLFAGLGGFHLALRNLGHRCVFACEIDEVLRNIYERNFNIAPEGDIREIEVSDIPARDILCAGFPCQPFSKAGDQFGFECPKSGDLFEHVLRIVKYHKPLYLILENVPNLEYHDDGRTWASIKKELQTQGYDIKYKQLSPHKFGIPQIRDRMFIVCSLHSLSLFAWPAESSNQSMSINSVLDQCPPDAKKISLQLAHCLAVWCDFIKKYPKGPDLPTFPIWSMEFGATYPYEDTTPYALGIDELRKYKGSHGVNLRTLPDDQVMPSLPAYARTHEYKFPDWKIDFIRKNRQLYKEQKTWIGEWIPRILGFAPSWQKLEWNCKGGERDIWKYVIQIRASGIRVKRKTTAPSLVAMTTTQVPIIAWERRYMTPRECARLQSMEKLRFLPEASTRTYKALGNAVNVTVVELVAKALFTTVG